MGRDPCGVYSISSFLLGIGDGHLWRFSAFIVFMRDAGWSFYFIYLFFVWRGVALRGIACSVYGALGWDPCGIYSVSSFLLGIEVGRLWRFSGSVAFMRHAGWTGYFIYFFRGGGRVALRVAFMGHWCGVLVHSVCSVYEALGLVAFLWHLECL